MRFLEVKMMTRDWRTEASCQTGSTLTVVWLCIVFLFGGLLQVVAQPGQTMDSYVQPNSTIREIFDRDKNYNTLDQLGPDGSHFMVPIRQEMSSLQLMTQRTLRLAMLEFCPDVNREWRLSTYGMRGLKIYSLVDRRSLQVQVPADILISHMTWSPDGQKIAFLAHLSEGTQVWTTDVSTGEAAPLNQSYVMATLGGRRQRGGGSGRTLLQWTPENSVITLLVPANRGPEPQADPIPGAPMIRRTREKPTPTRTLPFLLRTTHDQDLFRYYTTAQLAELAPGRPAKAIGRPGMYTGLSVSPDGRHILAEKVVEPFSYIVAATSFGQELEVLDRSGRRLSVIRKTPLQEASTRAGQNPNQDLPRDVAWRPDGKGLTFLQLAPKQDDEDAADREDRLMQLDAPFDVARATTLVSSEKRISGATYSRDGRFAFATLSGEEKQDIVAFDLNTQNPATQVLAGGIDSDDVLNLPGQLMTRRTGNGVPYALLSSDSSSAYLQGAGSQEDFKAQPFVDRVNITSGRKNRLFEGSKQMWERPLVPLDSDLERMIVSRESKTVFPDSYLWSSSGSMENLTQNRDPFPEITSAKRVDFSFQRRDGVTVRARISLPIGYVEGTRVPAIFWTYPNEYQSVEEYQRGVLQGRRSVPDHNSYSPLSYLRWSDIWLTQGYAVVYPDVPIIGKGNQFNDNYLAHMADTLYAAIRKVDEMGYVDVDRIGHGGHSYGAFATANLLAHTPYFKAGIAGDGAYNRSLTPMSFQGERRFVWEAQTTYLEMSPFFSADHIDTPLLMYHGAQDNNSGTFLIQSERMMQALTGLGKTAVLYIYPFESHAPVSKESLLDLWARWVDWFDTHVKNGGADRVSDGQ